LVTISAVHGTRFHIVESLSEERSCQRSDTHPPVTGLDAVISRIAYSLARDSFAMRKVRDLLEKHNAGSLLRLDDAGVARLLGQFLRSGRLRAVECGAASRQAAGGRGAGAESRADSQQDSSSGDDASGGAGSGASRGASKDTGPVKTWVAVELVDEEDAPMMFERYTIKLPDGTTQEGRLDGNGRVRFNGIDPGTCEITFPDFHSKEWRPA